MKRTENGEFGIPHSLHILLNTWKVEGADEEEETLDRLLPFGIFHVLLV